MCNQRSSIYGLSQTPSNFRVIAIISTYNEADVIVPVINHLAKEGVDTYLIDNWSTDKTFNLVNKIDRGIVGVERFPKGEPSSTYNWIEILKRKEELSWELDADWFMHYDADEIRESPWQNIKLKDAIYMVDQLGYNVIDFELLNFYPIDNNYQPGSPLEQYFKYFEFNDFSGNAMQKKAWKKSSERVKLWESGGHSVEFSNKKVFPYKFIMRHYPIRSQSQGENKIFNERQLRYNPKELEIGWHTQYNKITKGENFIRNPNSLLIFNPSFYDEFALRQIIERDEIEVLLRSELSGKIEELGATAHLLAETEQKLNNVTIQNVETEQRLSKASLRLSEMELALQAAVTRLKESERNHQETNNRLIESEQKLLETSNRLTEKEQKLLETNSELMATELKVSKQDLVISSIINSTGWKYAKLLNRVESKYFPLDSSRRKFVSSIMKIFFHPVSNLFRHRTIRRDLNLLNSSPLFDAKWYLENNQDIAKANIDPADHYLQYGGFEGRDPSPGFSSNWYLNTYPDVFAARINPLLHYLKYGQKEGRTISEHNPDNSDKI